MANRTKIHKQARQLKGQPVCITLHDGRSYVGWITGLEKDSLILSKPTRPNHTSKRNITTRPRPQKAEVSGLMPLFGSFLGGGGAGAAGAAGAAGFGGLGFFGMMQKVMPMIQMGYNMIKSIRPLLGGMKGLMG
ncbi:hypothetical protein [Paenibacillus sp. sgz500958]|uniref:hypothetical protein n=1 Tax=Paenibacillus sp. sgz500958 TaxID=3242475 RepID=UPI0036D3733E